MTDWQRVGKYRWQRGEYCISVASVSGTWVYTAWRGKTRLGSVLSADRARQLVDEYR